MRIYKFLFISMVVILVFPPFGHSADVAKIGIIDFQRIIEESEPGDKANAKINVEGKKSSFEIPCSTCSPHLWANWG